jgi:hypothetical protein
MFELIVAFAVGMIVMDLMWAWRLGLVQTAYQFIKWKLTKRSTSQHTQEQE